MELPFLQRVLGQFKLVPVVMGNQDYTACRALGVSLAKLIQGPGTLIVVSSDLSHYHPYDEAVKLDTRTLKAIEDWDYLSLSRNFERRVWEACGGGPIVAAMIAAERLGANRAVILKQANSGDVLPTQRDRVVGYGAVALIAAKPARDRKGAALTLNTREQAELLKIAKLSAETAVKQHKLGQVPVGESEALTRDRGAFVTLKEKGQLRGCIGYITPSKPLVETVRDVAAFAAVEDRRFSPVVEAELGQLQYEISVLSPLRRVMDVKDIRVGRHGLVVKKGEAEGILLPQVPVEQRWDRTTFLEQTCVKAGLPPQSWKDDETDIFMFSALVFGEHTIPEPVIPEPRNFRREEKQPESPEPDSPRP